MNERTLAPEVSKLELLKISLLSEGVKIGDDANDVISKQNKPVNLREYATTSGLILRLPGDVYVTASAFQDFCADSPNTLGHDGAGYYVRTRDGFEAKAELVPVPDYFDKTTKRGVPYASIGLTHTDRVRVSPVAGCSCVCLFCDVYLMKYALKGVDDILETVHVAANDPALPAKHILVSGGTPLPKDEGYLDEVIKRIAAESSLPTDVMMVPRRNLDYLEKLYSWGVNIVSFNIELFNQDVARSIMPQKHNLSMDFYLQRIEKAVDVFGRGRVQSLIIVGLEPLEDTLRGVEALAERGCVPVLSPFYVPFNTPLRKRKPLSSKELLVAYEEASRITAKHRIKLGPRCVPCQHNSIAFPDDSEFYVRY